MTVYCIATTDSKGAELRFAVDVLRSAGIEAISLDVSTGFGTSPAADISRGQVVASAAEILNRVVSPPWQLSDRGSAITAMAELLTAFLVNEHQHGRVAGVLGLGGSGGTALITKAMRALPIGLPKLMVSTVAAGNVAPYVDCSDIIMAPSVVDIAGLNSVSRQVLTQAAHAMAGMVHARKQEVEHAGSTAGVTGRRTVALTMFGVTTPCVTSIREQLEERDYDCLVFHAVGTGGRTMEQLVAAGLVQGVLDITTTEVADEVVGGVFPAGSERFQRIIAAGIPYVFSLGALDMVNFGARETIDMKFSDRRFHQHNAQVTLMRTTAAENRLFARWIATRVNEGTSPWTLLVPELGLSALDAPGQPFHDPQANAALFDELRQQLVLTSNRKIISFPLHINDSAFAKACLDEFLKLENSSA